ncbi:hypothetical protein MMC26_004117 [Xylographa opegraphella]|nr:hypothetical protein [Xylographa opegraphella]
MPPRKSNVSAVSAPTDENTNAQAGKEKEGINIEDLSMPRTMVQRLAKGVLPPNTQLQKDSITAFSKGATVFVNFLTYSAHAHTVKAQRKTIAPADVLLGLRDTEFEFMIPRLEAELNRYNEVQTAKRNEYRKKVREGTMGVGRRKSNAGATAATGFAGEVTLDGGKDGERAAKRSKLDEEGNAAMVGAGDDGDETEEEEEEEEVVEAEEGEGEGEAGEAGEADEDGEEEADTGDDELGIEYAEERDDDEGMGREKALREDDSTSDEESD